MQFNIKLPIHIQDTVGPSKETWKLKWLPAVKSLFKPKLPPPPPTLCLCLCPSVCQFPYIHVYGNPELYDPTDTWSADCRTTNRWQLVESRATNGQQSADIFQWDRRVLDYLCIYPERPRFLSMKCYINWYLFCFQCQVCSLHFLHTFCCVCDIWQLNIKC